MQFMYDDDIIPRMALGESITMRTKREDCVIYHFHSTMISPFSAYFYCRHYNWMLCMGVSHSHGLLWWFLKKKFKSFFSRNSQKSTQTQFLSRLFIQCSSAIHPLHSLLIFISFVLCENDDDDVYVSPTMTIKWVDIKATLLLKKAVYSWFP